MTRKFLVFTAILLASVYTNSQEVVTIDTSDKDHPIFDKVEVEASFPQGEAGWRSYIERNLNPNVPVKNGAPLGAYTVYVQFVVEKDGTVSQVTGLTNHGYGMEKEVIRILQKGPKWSPAMQNGKPVRAYRKQPITFVVQDGNIEVITKKKYILDLGVENVVTINVKRVKDEDITATISQGTITPKGGGRYIVNVTNRGVAVIKLFHAGKKNKEVGAVAFDVQ